MTDANKSDTKTLPIMQALLKGVVVATITGLVRSRFVDNKVAVSMKLFRCN